MFIFLENKFKLYILKIILEQKHVVSYYKKRILLWCCFIPNALKVPCSTVTKTTTMGCLHPITEQKEVQPNP